MKWREAAAGLVVPAEPEPTFLWSSTPPAAPRCTCGCEEELTVARLAADRTYRGVCAACRCLWPSRAELADGRTPVPA